METTITLTPNQAKFLLAILKIGLPERCNPIYTNNMDELYQHQIERKLQEALDAANRLPK